MTSDELLDLFRKDVVDTAQPYLWSDAEVYAYMNDAYTMFVRLIGGIPDYLTDDVCLVTASAGEPYSETHPSILRFRGAHLEATGDTVRIINAQDMEQLQDEDFGILRRLSNVNQRGKVRHMVIGRQQNTVQWVSTPDTDYEVRLLVERLPLNTITDGGQNFADVAAHHHLHFLKWMKYLAYSKQDAETFDKAKADFNRADFENYCDFAKREKDRAKHKVRVVRYGGL